MDNPEFTSLTPQYKFPETLEEQKAQLKDNPLLQRMLKARFDMRTDPVSYTHLTLPTIYSV